MRRQVQGAQQLGLPSGAGEVQGVQAGVGERASCTWCSTPRRHASRRTWRASSRAARPVVAMSSAPGSAAN
ncbi:hypothetical protein ACH4GK_37750 [Streptomyces rimosus]|uniref:hypothetical protein n=1 Tax=Streptomyces rimosus TaxID=1927 RepID=UPI00131E79C6|nr:hypothetical protein [Streptomyces rimosus]